MAKHHKERLEKVEAAMGVDPQLRSTWTENKRRDRKVKAQVRELK